ncbi:LysR family transcriptional regulator [Shewanella sp. Isolate8]|uniref:LysR family transcriptional regulator n=1 Tax=Shewanella sp. Isolate8 TaxID=2908529 RepID=UPI001EFD1772|nr:LysR family transcriptional regulator [Shewanella sp. Isolate8]MCG9748418.1 LysR family transcriptional regulator [Shewanella sp. Isolate8]
MINPVWLRSFCTLVELGHFTRTAERLHMTQSGVSQHVRKLEEQFDTQLLLREGKKFSLTHAGRQLYQQGQAILQSLAQLEQGIKQDPPFAGEVRLISPGSVGLKLYGELLELQCAHPELSLDYRFASNAGVESAIAAMEADIGLMTRQPELTEVQAEPIAKEPLLLVTPASQETVSWEALQQMGFFDHPDGAHHAKLLLGANYPEFEHSDQLPNRGFSNQIGLILEPVSRGLGFTVLPAYAVEAFARQELIRAHRLPNAVSEPIYLCRRRRSVLAKRVESVREVIKASLA